VYRASYRGLEDESSRMGESWNRCNLKRLHCTLPYLTAEEFEQAIGPGKSHGAV
jgi:hypothetical protein